MIISLDIPTEKHVEYAFQGYARSVYGLAFAYHPDSNYCGYLSQSEDLYLSGHGTPQSIGHVSGEPCLGVEDLAVWLRRSVLPFGYFGDLYIAAPGCTTGFLSDLNDCLRPHYEGGVFGHFGEDLKALPKPVPPGWISVA